MSEGAAGIATELSPQRAGELIDGGATVIDVRRPYEFEGGRIPGSRNIEMNSLVASAESIPRDTAVIFVCRSGNRSGMARDAFREAGYDAYNLAGGVQAWAQEGRALDPADGEVRAPQPVS